MIDYPDAKINIGLFVKSKLEDGYHEIETVLYPVALRDILEIIPAKVFSFETSGLKIPGEHTNNLVVRAWEMMRDEFSIGNVAIHLHKKIPTGAGLGGGSSDAAFTIKILNDIFALNLGVEKMEDIARRLGADCAFFIQNRPVFACHKGDRFEAIDMDLSKYKIYIIKPPFSISTAEAYRNVTLHPGAPDLRAAIQSPVETWQGKIGNDFEAVVNGNYPLHSYKDFLYANGALYAAMSGSGSAVYGIFEKDTNLPDGEIDGVLYEV